MPPRNRVRCNTNFVITAAPSNDAFIVKAKANISLRKLQSCCVLVIACQQVCDSQRVKIERAPAGNAKLSKANSAKVLNSCPESCARDNDIHDFSASNSSRVIARKRTRLPTRKSTGGSFCASNNRNGVRPITFQPPGDT